MALELTESLAGAVRAYAAATHTAAHARSLAEVAPAMGAVAVELADQKTDDAARIVASLLLQEYAAVE